MNDPNPDGLTLDYILENDSWLTQAECEMLRAQARELLSLRERVAELEAKIMELDAENAWTRIQKS
jgi:hypothetical protein